MFRSSPQELDTTPSQAGGGVGAFDRQRLHHHAPRMRRRRLFFVGTAIAVVLLAAAGLFRLSGFWPGPALPAGATALRLATKPAGPLPGYCPGGTFVPPVRIAAVGGDLVLVPEAGGDPLNVGFPHGWQAWRVDGRAELISRDGDVVGREGDVLRHLNARPNDLAYLVCDGGA